MKQLQYGIFYDDKTLSKKSIISLQGSNLNGNLLYSHERVLETI